ncbi:XRE family transcriptional regulator [Streptomyces kunmingensis]|uniref:XRE family transcriptional regulator n=1 Tax=Streptomyces kunmingensis TaxID=68225 RepID=A0ABU6CNR6_9ACTN|nr:XRE family transcriptional regulator [Streptomyces kunmingensis]MEB3966358.1 XRE family transcriptional regulator [Streptomyces kunmingensis]
MNEYRPPTALPREALELPDMQAAFKTHDFGTVFRLARLHAQISYSKIAAECDIKPERVGSLAKGRGSITSFEKIAVIADALRIPGRLLGLADRSWEASGTTREGAVAVRRRDFVRKSTVTAAGLVGLVPLEVGQRIGVHDVEQLKSRAARLRRLDDTLGGGDTFKLYLSEFQSTRVLMRDHTYSENVGRMLRSVMAEQAQQAGWAAFDVGRHPEAAGLYEASKTAAREAGDMALEGNAYAFLGYQHSGGDRSKAVATAIQSCRTAGPEAPAGVRALLHERLAWAHAVAGHPRDVAAALEIAEEALRERGGDLVPDWAAWVDTDELEIMKGRCWTELRRPLRSVPVLESVLTRFDDTRARDKALYLSWLAESYLAAGEVEGAATTAGRALSLSAGIASVRPRQRLHRLLDSLRTYSNVSEVRKLLERIEG